MGQIDEERLAAQQNVRRVAQAGRAAGEIAQLAGLKTFNWLFRPWSILLLLAVAGMVTWGAFTYLESEGRQLADQAERDRAVDEFSKAVQDPEPEFRADIRSGRCIYGVTRIDCVYGHYRISNGTITEK